MAFLPLLGLAASAGGALLGGISQGMAASYQSKVSRQNAQIAHQNAQRAAAATAADTEVAGMKAAEENAGVRVAAAANGLDVNTGSPADVAVSQREIGAFDVKNTAYKGALATYGYETQQVSDTAQANIESAEAPFDYAGGILKGAGSIMGGAPEVPALYRWMTPGAGAQGPSGGSSVSVNGGGYYGDNLLD